MVSWNTINYFHFLLLFDEENDTYIFSQFNSQHVLSVPLLLPLGQWKLLPLRMGRRGVVAQDSGEKHRDNLIGFGPGRISQSISLRISDVSLAYKSDCPSA